MKPLSAIVAVDNNWAIGLNGELLARISGDLRHFRAYTTGKTVILGSKTLATFPGGRPLKNRRNIVLSRRPDFAPEGAEVARSVEEVLSLLDDGEDAVVIGGESVYRQLLPFCREVAVTRFDVSLPHDAIFPDLDADPAWEIAAVGEPAVAEETDSHPGIAWRVIVYRRR